jgi:predicted nucleic acid-binding protein
MPYLVDSDWVIDHLDRIPQATELLSALAADGLYVSIVTYMEVYQGTLRSDVSSTVLDDLRDFVAFAPILHSARRRQNRRRVFANT